MASCSYSQIVGGQCGVSISNPANVQCVLIGNCGKDTRGHLKATQLRDPTLDGAMLLLDTAG